MAGESGRFAIRRVVLIAFALLGLWPAAAAHAGSPTPSDIEREFTGLLNIERADRGLRPVEISPALTEIADDYVAENARLNDIDHDRDGPYVKRANAAGCGKWLGPVLAQGYTSAKEVLDAWLSSSGHRAVLLDPEITHLGPGFQDDHALAFGMVCDPNSLNTSGDFGDAFVKPSVGTLSGGRVWLDGRKINARATLSSGTAKARLVARRGSKRIRGKARQLTAGQMTRLTVRVPRGRWKIELRGAGQVLRFTSPIRVR